MAIRFPKMSDMKLEISLEAAPEVWLYAGEGVTDITVALNEETTDKYYMNKAGAKTTVKQGMQRTFTVTGDLAVGDPFVDAIMAHDFKFGNSRTVKYRYYDMITKKGEQGTAEVLINNDGSGPANENMTYDVTISASGIPTAYTHTP